MDSMTVLTREMFEQTQTIETIDEAVDLLLNYEHFRTLGDVLRQFSGAPDLKASLVAGLQHWNQEDKPDSIDRKVRNWLNGKTQSISKQDAFVISRIMHLTLEQTEEFLKYAAGEGIHWRNPEDIVWGYAIIHDRSLSQTKVLLEHAGASLASVCKRQICGLVR